MGLGQGALPRLLAAVAGVVVAMALLEVVARLVVPPSPTQLLRGLHRTTPEHPWLYELTPNQEIRGRTTGDVVYATNADGFRDHAYARAKPGGTFRIAVVGDSVSFGYGVDLDETFAKQIEGRLQGLGTGPHFEVLNLGVSGYNPYTETELLHGVALGYQPDLVLVQFCINDLNDPTQHFDASTMLALGAIPDAAYPDPGARRPPSQPAEPGRLGVLCGYSRICGLLADALAPAAPREEMIAALKPHDDPSDGEIAWLERLYARMARDTRSRGGELAVVVFPYETQLEAGAPSMVQEKIRALGARAGVVVIDLLPAFRRAAAESDERLFLDMWHPTARGQRVAAEEIQRALACDQLLPGVAARCASSAAAISPSGS